MHATDIALSQLVVSNLNVRKTLDVGQEDSNIGELADSLREKGLLSPLTVRPLSTDRFEIVAGQRRYLACKLVPIDPVPCFVKEGLSDGDAVSLSLIENVHRADMHPIDKAKAFKTLYAKHGSHDGVAQESACSIQTVRRYLKLLDLPVILQDRIGTADGPSGISAMSRLASTFEGEDAIAAYDKISGFTQRVQEEILKRSNGDLDQVEQLVEEAQEGVFDIRRCGTASGCQLIQDIVQGRLSQADFGTLINTAARETREPKNSSQLREAAISFWRAITHVDL